MTIFISHSHKDDDFVDRLRSDLHKLGHHTWVDHHDIPAGKLWDEVVEAELLTSDAMILIVSPSSMNSKEVGIEWREFRNLKKPILPVKLLECPVPLLLCQLQFVDFTDTATYPQQFKRLIKDLPPPPLDATLPLKLDTKEFEIIRLKRKVEELQIKIETFLGFNQILFAFPELEKTAIFDLDFEKVFVGWSDRKSGVIPHIDLTRFGAHQRGVSRQHAMLVQTPYGLTITDLDSSNGTFIDEWRLPSGKPIPLQNETMLHLGGLAAQVFYRMPD
jgi:hypothetical protein